jgi:glycosyltransferase involved in cell wall biosynthesis
MKLTLIITTYNWPESLLLVIESIKRQTILPDEIIIADDGSSQETKKLIATYMEESLLNIIHSWQKDIGFRVARSRNKAVFKSTGDYIILIDGDVILHSNFIQDHIVVAESGYFIQGSRVLLTEQKTKKTLEKNNIHFSFFSAGIKNRKNSIHSEVLSIIFSKKKNHLNGIKSCNMAFYKKDFFDINGFNNEFVGWGREDSEFIVRLMNNGIRRKTIRFKAIQFHLWHNENIRVSLDENNAILQEAIKKNSQWCDNGVNSIKKL